MQIPIIFEDNHLLVVSKPCNLLMQADKSQDPDLLNLLKDYLVKKYQKPGAAYLAMVSRLDRPVGGVVVLAKTSKAAQRLNQAFSKQAVTKKYLAIIETNNIAKSGNFEDYLIKDNQKNMVTVTTPDKGKLALLDYKLINQSQNLALIEINLITGRPHQIRVQFASRNLPLWGDQRYNKKAQVGQQIALWSSQLSFSHPTLKTELNFIDLPPETIPWNNFKRSSYDNLSQKD